MVSTRGQAWGLLAKVEVGGGLGEESTTSVSVGIGVDVSVSVNIVNLVDGGEAATAAEGAAADAIRIGTKPDTSSMYLAGGHMVRTGRVDMREGSMGRWW